MFLGCAIGTKFQAILVTPMILAYWASYRWDDFKRAGPHAEILRKILREGCRLGVTLGGIFWIWNPYIIHPMGFKAFNRLLGINLSWGTELVSVIDRFRFGVMLPYAGPFVIGLGGVAVVTSIVIGGCRWADFEDRLMGIVGGTAVFNIIYTVLAVNKGWPHYYLVPVVLVWIAGVHSVCRWNNWISMSLLAICIGVNLNYGIHTVCGELLRRDAEIKRDVYRGARESVTRVLRPMINPGDTVLSTTVSIVDFRALGILYLNIDAELNHIQRRYVIQTAHDDYFRSNGFSIAPPFRNHTWIVIDKQTPYFYPGLAVPGDREFYRDGRVFISELVNGNWGYGLVYESSEVLILRQR